MHSSKLRSTAAIVMAGAALGGVAGGGAVALIDGGSTTTVVPDAATSSRSTVADTTSTTGLSAGEIYQRSANSVVQITASGGGGQVATGTGFFISTSGEIVTNAHVVDGASKLTVKLANGTTRTATLVGKDTSSDIALLRIDAKGLKITALKLADSSKVQVGDPTAAIGNPYGLDETLTTGVVSALHRTITAPNGFAISDAIQTDAALNPGNSGGPLFNTQGEVIGVNSQIYSDSQSNSPFGSSSSSGNTGLGFAVPSSTVSKVVLALRSGGQVEHAYLGVSAGDAQGGAGATVGSVTRGGPAAAAGLRAGDTILAVGGRTVTTGDELTAAVDAHAPGDTVSVLVDRGGHRVTLQVRLGTRPANVAS
jgi:putative serine protease PepD